MKDFNQIEWKTKEFYCLKEMQLLHGYDEVNFPFVIATDSYDWKQVFLVNVNTQVRLPLINLNDCIHYKYIRNIR